MRRAQTAEAGFNPGWDLAGTVERAAADGTGPRAGARVVGLLPSEPGRAGRGADELAVGAAGSVSFELAATLPVAGLTALYALEKGGGLIGRSVLVTGASGGAGNFGLQLARLSGARVVALVRREEHEDLVHEAGAHQVAVGEDASSAERFGPYHLVLESVGGQVLGRHGMLAPVGPASALGFGRDGGYVRVRSFYLRAREADGFILFTRSWLTRVSTGWRDSRVSSRGPA